MKRPSHRFYVATKSIAFAGGNRPDYGPSVPRHWAYLTPMDGPPPDTHSFVVRVWPKRVENAEGDASWRGSITHVETGERMYLESLTEIPGVIAPYVVETGGTLDLRTRLCLWMASLALPETAPD